MIFFIPLTNFIYFLCKPSVRSITKKTNIILHSITIGINVIFAVLLVTFVFVYPDFIAHIGKPLFPIDYAISIPVGPYIILIIAVASLVFEVINFVKILLKKPQ
jgi:hypothetical protein